MMPAGNPPGRFEFATASRILFGAGVAREIGPTAREFGTRALVVTGSQPARVASALESLAAAGLESRGLVISGEPTLEQVAAGVALSRSWGAEVVVGVGGGSVIDAAKAIAGLAASPHDLLEHLEVIGRGRPLEAPVLPWIAVPTTAGAGAEVTRNAVLTSPGHGVKASLRSPRLLARAAIVDPTLTLSLPPPVTAATGLDALTQLIEPFVCVRANGLVDALCRDGMPRVARHLATAFAEGSNLEARSQLAFAALQGGLALANAGLGVVHGLAAPIGGAYPGAPHGAVCAALLPHAMRANLQALASRGADSPAGGRYHEVARLLTGADSAVAEDGVRWIHELVRHLGIPGLRSHGMERTAFPDLAAKASAASSMKANPIALTAGEIMGILEAAW